MQHYFRIWAKYGDDSGQSLIAERINGDRIFTRQQAAGIIRQWAEMARDGRMMPLHDIKIEKYTMEN